MLPTMGVGTRHRGRSVVRVVTSAVVLLVSSCSDKPSEVDEFFAAMNGLYCQKVYSCCDDGERAYLANEIACTAPGPPCGDGSDYGSCVAVSRERAAFYSRDYEASRRSGRFRIDLPKVRACADGLRAGSCDAYFHKAWDCGDTTFIVPAVGPGGSCTTDWDCTTRSCLAGACQPEPRCTNYSCPAGSACDFPTRTCQPQATCAPGLVRVLGVCSEPLAIDAWCHDDRECASGYCSLDNSGRRCRPEAERDAFCDGV